MKNNFLITINNLDDLDYLKELGFKNYAYPLKGFCVGIPNTFLISEIREKEKSFLYLNRVLDNEGIDNFKKLLPEVAKFRGIIFDDLGILEVIKDLKLEKILFLNHFNANHVSVKYFSSYVDSVVICPDILYEDMENIVALNKDTSLFVFGYPSSMYSRRLLLSNYKKFHQIECDNPLDITNTNHDFFVFENEYGTVIYHKPVFNGYKLLNIPSKYYLICSFFLKVEDIKDFLDGNLEIPYDEGFLNHDTIYKLRGDDND